MAIFYSSYFIICAQKRLYEKVLPDTLGKGWKSVATLQILRDNYDCFMEIYKLPSPLLLLSVCAQSLSCV